MDEGYIKFDIDWQEEPIVGFQDEISALIKARELLYGAGLIGVYSNGIGYGNISMRAEARQFVISGSKTGSKSRLEAADFALVTGFDLTQNRVSCQGLTVASSESMTHAAVYATAPGVKTVLHIHSQQDWSRLLDQVPTTGATVAYGTPAMAREVERLFAETDLSAGRIFCMAGHEEGIVSFGETTNDAMEALKRNGISLTPQ